MPIVIARDDFDSEDPYAVVLSNIDYVNRLRDAWLAEDEISHEAWVSYVVDYFQAQLEDGGFPQFVYNSAWSPAEVALVREGLAAMHATGHLEVFERGAAIVESIGDEELAAFFEGPYFGDNPIREQLAAVDDAFAELEEDLIERNATWIRGRPDLVVLTSDEIEAKVAEQAAAIPDLEARIAEAREHEPRYAKVIRRLLEAVGLELGRVTAANPNHVHEGHSMVACHFLTADEEHYYQLDFGDEAAMYDPAGAEVVRVPVGDL